MQNLGTWSENVILFLQSDLWVLSLVKILTFLTMFFVCFYQVFVAKQKLMVDVGAILRNIDKSGEYELPEVSNYLRRYREFSGMFQLSLFNPSVPALKHSTYNKMFIKAECFECGILLAFFTSKHFVAFSKCRVNV